MDGVLGISTGDWGGSGPGPAISQRAPTPPKEPPPAPAPVDLELRRRTRAIRVAIRYLQLLQEPFLGAERSGAAPIDRRILPQLRRHLDRALRCISRSKVEYAEERQLTLIRAFLSLRPASHEQTPAPTLSSLPSLQELTRFLDCLNGPDGSILVGQWRNKLRHVADALEHALAGSPPVLDVEA